MEITKVTNNKTKNSDLTIKKLGEKDYARMTEVNFPLVDHYKIPESD